MRFAAARHLDMLMGVLDHDDGSVDHGADGDGDPPEAHDVGIQALPLHDDEADQHAHGKREDDDEGAAQVEEKNRANHGHDQAFFHQGALEIVDRPQDQAGAVINLLDAHAFGKTGLDFLNSFFDIAWCLDHSWELDASLLLLT